MLILVVAAAAADPSVTFAWNRGLGRATATAPTGWHLAPDAPASVEVSATAAAPWQSSGTRRGDPAALSVAVPATPFSVQVDFSICTDGGTECRPVRFVGVGAPSRRGSLVLQPPPAPPPAISRGSVVRLYDFTAVWCPPCNLLAAEVLHDPDHAEDLTGLVIEAVDVDQPSSWALKSRYAVGGYPTVVAVDGQGDEVARMVGYPGEAATVAWLAGLGTTVPLSTLEARDPSITGAAASAAARRLAEADRAEDARFYFARAADDVDLHIARLALDGAQADAEWLIAHAPPGEWILAALDAAPDRWPAVVPMLADLEPVVAADVLDVLGAKVGGDAGRALAASALVTVKAALDGDPNHDKAHVGYLADLYVRVGRLDDGIALLDHYRGIFPAEFTYDHAAARLLLDAGRYPEAEARGRIALAKAWGDQRLRAVQPLARAIARQGRAAEAIALIDQVLAAAEKPAPGVAVRTHRYVSQVNDLRAELSALR